LRLKQYINENKLVIYDNNLKEIESRKLLFTKKNIEKIANDYDAEIQKIEFSTKTAVLKDNLGRLMFVDFQKSKVPDRIKNKIYI